MTESSKNVENTQSASYETLDPQDWSKMRSLAHQMIDDTFDLVQNIRQDPVWRPIPQEIRKKIDESVPLDPEAPEKVYEDFKELIMPYHMGCIHPRFWAWYMGGGTVMGALGDYLTSMITSNVGGGNHIGPELESQVIKWMLEVTSYPEDASGILVSGGSMANYIGLAVARHEKSINDIRQEGLVQAGVQYAVYASTEVHSCNQKAVELLGIGAEFLRKIRVNADFTINLAELKKQITQDRQEGIIPICIIGSAGTVNTGAVDDLQALADIAEAEDMWFHVDGAIGGIAMIADKVRPQLKGIERSDSLAIDLHKWLHIPFEAGCVLIQNRSLHHETFALIPDYLAPNKEGLASGKIWYSEYGLQLSRRMRALKIWMSVKEHGMAKFGRMIDRNVDQAHYLGQLVADQPSLQLMAPIGMDIVCFQYIKRGLSQEEMNELNRNILIRLQEEGHAAPSYTTLRGSYCIRVAIANHRSQLSDFDYLIEKVIEIGDRLSHIE